MVKQEVLAALDAVRGRYISGQELAAQLGVSRTAVWKAVAALRRDGIPIKAVTNRGYTLAQSVDVLNAAAVAVQLDETTVKALQIEVVDRLPGTNAALRSRADAGAREGLVLIAQAQSAGRGRGGHSFYSPPGGLYMSILLRPEIGARQAVGLTAMAAVAAARAAERLCGVPITIKCTRYGSCSGKNSLCFSCFLMNCPDAAMDLVVVHELCHIQVKNHGPDFYALLEQVLPDWRERKKLLR